MSASRNGMVIAVALWSWGSGCASNGAAPSHPVEVEPQVRAADEQRGTDVSAAAPAPAAEPHGAALAERDTAFAASPVPPTVPSSDDVIATLRAPVEVDIESLRRRIEENTQAEVERIRKGPAGLLAVSFAPTSPPRTESDLMRIVELLRELPEFRSVEPERRYRAQQGPAVPQK